MNVTDEMLANALIAVAHRIRSGKCEMTQEQRDSVFESLEQAVDIPISKEQACGMMGISRSTFDSKVATGEIPAGRHRRGFKEKFWFKRDLLLLPILMMVISCSPKLYPPTVRTDSVRVEIREHVDTVISTVTIEREVERIVTRDTLSHLENSYAKSEAKVSGGTLSHSLETKPQVIHVPVYVHTHDTLFLTREIVKESVPEKSSGRCYRTTMGLCLWMGIDLFLLLLLFLLIRIRK